MAFSSAQEVMAFGARSRPSEPVFHTLRRLAVLRASLAPVFSRYSACSWANAGAPGEQAAPGGCAPVGGYHIRPTSMVKRWILY